MSDILDDDENVQIGPIADEDAWDEAVARLKRGDLPEAIIWLARAAPEHLDDLPRIFDRHVKRAVDSAIAAAQQTSRRAAA